MNAASTFRVMALRARWAFARMAAFASSRDRRGATALLLLGLVVLLSALWGLTVVNDRRAQPSAAPSPRAAKLVTATLSVAPDIARLRAFTEYLPHSTEAPRVLAELIDRAEESKVTLAQGSYQTIVDAAGGYARVRMIHPVSGTTDDIHRYLLDSLRTHRTLALESVQFKRPDPRGSAVEARIQWVLFMRAPDGSATQGHAP